MDIALDSFKQLSDTSLVDWTTLKVKRVKKERKLFGNMTFHVDLPNSVLVEIKLFVRLQIILAAINIIFDVNFYENRRSREANIDCNLTGFRVRVLAIFSRVTSTSTKK